MLPGLFPLVEMVLLQCRGRREAINKLSSLLPVGVWPGISGGILQLGVYLFITGFVVVVKGSS